jgi:hypothetical protein
MLFDAYSLLRFDAAERAPNLPIANVRFGSKADMTGRIAMSALPSKADIARRQLKARFVIEADIELRAPDVRFTPESGRRSANWVRFVMRASRSLLLAAAALPF